ncbi:MAG: hypothetical protein STSR0004_18980 [Peptococcaceae bacterium]
MHKDHCEEYHGEELINMEEKYYTVPPKTQIHLWPGGNSFVFLSSTDTLNPYRATLIMNETATEIIRLGDGS